MDLVVPVFLCNCGEQIVLPHRSPLEIPGGHYYWPTNTPILSVVCPECGHTSGHSHPNLRWAELQALPCNPPKVFWRIEIECAQSGCEFPVVLHAITTHTILPKRLEDLVRDAVGETKCVRGFPHRIQGGRFRAEVIDWELK